MTAKGEQYYTEAQKTTTAAGTQASKGLTDLINRTRSLSLTKPEDATENNNITESSDSTEQAPKDATEHPDRPDSLPADIVKEAQSIVSRFRSEAAKRLKDIERAEDALIRPYEGVIHEVSVDELSRDRPRGVVAFR